MKIASIILSTMLSSLILFNSMQVSLTFAYYEIDPIGFIEQLCENLDKPELECNGKCQLKKVAESNSTKNNKIPNIVDFKELLLFKNSLETHTFGEGLITSSKNYNYTNLYFYLNSTNCFHPPQIVVS